MMLREVVRAAQSVMLERRSSAALASCDVPDRINHTCGVAEEL
jgi:hypothetical protein